MEKRFNDELVLGELVKHGAAKYRFQPEHELSYYVKIQTPEGMRFLWGKDLERAIRQSISQVKVGDRVGVRRVASETVLPCVVVRKAHGPEPPSFHRTRWLIEKQAFLLERARLARRLRDERTDTSKVMRAHPQVGRTQQVQRVAYTFAQQYLSDAKDRERFVALVKEAVESVQTRRNGLLLQPQDDMRALARDSNGEDARVQVVRVPRER